jgi:protoheme IX farnesyltransferase
MKMMQDYIALTKPRVTWLILLSTAIGYYLGALRVGWSAWTLVHCILGTGLLASGTAALNQWYERNADARMRRTQDRPIPAGRVSAPNAFVFGLLLIVLGTIELWLGANRLSALLGLFTVASYLLAYTPLKQLSPHSTTVGAIPGAMPPLMGYAASAGFLNTEAWLLFAILFLWQFPHFYAIAWMYREDYERAGIRMLPVVEPDGASTARRIFWTSLALVPLSLMPSLFGLTGPIYLLGAQLAGFAFAFFCCRVLEECSRQRARQVLLASVIYLPVLYVFLVADRAIPA